jgi:hypothetical protein
VDRNIQVLIWGSTEAFTWKERRKPRKHPSGALRTEIRTKCGSHSSEKLWFRSPLTWNGLAVQCPGRITCRQMRRQMRHSAPCCMQTCGAGALNLVPVSLGPTASATRSLLLINDREMETQWLHLIIVETKMAAETTCLHADPVPWSIRRRCRNAALREEHTRYPAILWAWRAEAVKWPSLTWTSEVLFSVSSQPRLNRHRMSPGRYLSSGYWVWSWQITYVTSRHVNVRNAISNSKNHRMESQ